MHQVSEKPVRVAAHARYTKARMRLGLLLCAVLMGLGVAGCQTLGYYAQSVEGHMRLMNAARPVSDWLNDPATPPTLQAKLQLAQQARDFASQQLHLPDNASYRSFTDLKRRAAVWNVAAAPPHALQLKSFCFVVLGCVSYQGYFDEAEAQNLGAQLRAEGWEVDVYPVPAYSTLGKLNWLGGDPLLSTFMHHAEADWVGLLFHELAHQQVYVAHDSAFNESYATAVERLGVRRWLQARSPEVRAAYVRDQAHRQAFRVLQQDTRVALAAVYANEPANSEPPFTPLADVLARKAQVMAEFQQAYAALKLRWAEQGAPDARWDHWVSKANNASFGMQAVYQGWVPAFERLFVQEGCDWRRFAQAAQALGEQAREARDARLRAWTQEAAANSGESGCGF